MIKALRGGFMSKKDPWSRIRHAYITGTLSYKKLAKKYGVSYSTLNKEARAGGWAAERKKYRDEVAAAAIARAREREVDKLAAVTEAADEMGRVLKDIMEERKNLHMFQAVTSDRDGIETIEEKELEMYNTDTIRTLTRALKDMTDVLRNLHGIRTAGEAEAERIAQERLDLEKRKAEAQEDTDRTLEVRFVGDTSDAAG